MILTRTADDIARSLSDPLDPEREGWLANRKRFVLDERTGVVVPVKTVGGSSFITGIPTETLYSSAVAGTAHTYGSATEVVLNDAAMGQQANIPAWFFGPSPQNVGRALRLVVRGVYSTTSAPTATWTVRMGATNSISASIVGISGAIVMGTTQSNLIWELEEDITLQTEGTTFGANSSLRGLGLVTACLTNITIGGGSITGNAAASATGIVATVDLSVNNYINVNGSMSGASASNILTILQMLVLGLN